MSLPRPASGPTWAPMWRAASPPTTRPDAPDDGPTRTGAQAHVIASGTDSPARVFPRDSPVRYRTARHLDVR